MAGDVAVEPVRGGGYNVAYQGTSTYVRSSAEAAVLKDRVERALRSGTRIESDSHMLSRAWGRGTRSRTGGIWVNGEFRWSLKDV